MAETVLVTGVGGNVGQGVLRILRFLDRGFRLVGTNTEAVSGGCHLCDVVRTVPPAVDPAYPEAMRRICREERVALVLPCTDAETFALAQMTGGLPPVAVSPPAVARTFLDKWETAQAFAAAGIPFARSWLPQAWDGTRPCIVKPREGRGSRGISVDPPDPRAFDEGQIVQERILGDEITIPFYVDRRRRLHAYMVMRRELHAGATVKCEVVNRHDAAVEPVLRRLVSAFDVRGSVNLQAIVRPTGEVVPFEVNCRISGTASIRHHFGFRDVEWTVDEHLRGAEPAPARLSGGSALRLLMDVVYPDLPLDAPRDRNSAHRVF